MATLVAVQVSLALRDLTLRVFAITRFRGKKQCENCTVIFSHRVFWWRGFDARAPAGHILAVHISVRGNVS
jgi:hypothetical protein